MEDCCLCWVINTKKRTTTNNEQKVLILYPKCSRAQDKKTDEIMTMKGSRIFYGPWSFLELFINNKNNILEL